MAARKKGIHGLGSGSAAAESDDDEPPQGGAGAKKPVTSYVGAFRAFAPSLANCPSSPPHCAPFLPAPLLRRLYWGFLFFIRARAGSGQAVQQPKSAKEAMEAILRGESAAQAVGGGGGGGEKVALKITFWKTGYQIDDEDIMPYDTKEGIEFMKIIMLGKIPPQVMTPERAALQRAGALDAQIIDSRGQDPPPPPTVRVFKGASKQVGGGGAPAVATAVVQDSAGAPAPACDEGKPHTTVQIKLADGKRLAVKLNLTSSVEDLQRTAAGAHATGGKPFVLKAGFPPRALDVPCATIEAAGLQGASVTQTIV
jgi:UBX domain-containing protein 1